MINLTAVLKLNDQFTSPMRRAVKHAERLDKVTRTLTSATSTYSSTNSRLASVTSQVATSTASAETKTADLKRTLNSAATAASSMQNQSNSVTASLKSWAAGIMGVYGAQKLLNATVGEAMRVDHNRVSLQALFAGDKRAAEQLSSFIRTKATDSVMSYQDALSTTQSFATTTKDVGSIKKMVNLTERLSYLNPMEGFTGAGFAIKEALSGDYVSIKDRFNLSNEQIAPLKAATSQTEKLAALNAILNKIGVTSKYLTTVNSTPWAKWQKLIDTSRFALLELGEAALKSVAPAIDRLTAFMSSPAFDQFKNKAASAFASAFENVSQIVTSLYNNRQAIADFASGAIQVLTDVGTAIKNVALFVVNNWSVIKPIIVGVATSFLAFKTVTTAITLVRGAIMAFNSLKNVFGYVKKTFTLLRLSMLTFPGGWLIIAIGAVVAAGVRLYKNWDKVKAKAGQLWTWIKGKWQSIKDWTAKTWDSVKTKIGSAMDSARKKVSNFFSPLMNFIGNAREKWNGFINAIKSFRMPKFKMPSFGGIGGAKGKGNFHGLSSVPYNGYTTALHKGEMVLPRKEADAYRRGTTGGNVTNLTVHYHGGQKLDEQEMARFSDWLLRKIEQAEAGGA